MLLSKEFDRLGIALPNSKDDFKALISGLDLTSEEGQKLYGSLITLSGAFSDVSDEAEKAYKCYYYFIKQFITKH